jgi:hypothetical protein
MSPRVATRPRRRPTSKRSSYAEFRAARRDPSWLALDVEAVYGEHAGVWWKRATAPPPLGGEDVRGVFLSEDERRTLSKASGSVGGYLVPSDFEAQIMSIAHTRATIGQLARTVTTPSGITSSITAASTHGVATWTAENAAFTASDEVFATPVALNAFKATTQVIVSEELAADATGGFDAFLAEELGSRIAQLEENPAATVPNPEPKRTEVATFALDELELVADELDPSWRALPVFAGLTGLRPCEWMALERADIDRRAGVVYVRRTLVDGTVKGYGKTDRSLRTVPLPARAALALDEQPVRRILACCSRPAEAAS